MGYYPQNYPGAIIFRQITGDTTLYYSDGVKWVPLGSSSDLESYALKDSVYYKHIIDSLLMMKQDSGLSILKRDSGLTYITPYVFDTVYAAKADTGYTPSLQKVTSVDSSTTHDLLIGGMTIGRGGGSSEFNIALGYHALYATTSAGISNAAIGYNTLRSNTSGGKNMGIGTSALYSSTTGSNNIGIGYKAGMYTSTGSTNNPSYSIYIGSETAPLGPGETNEIVIGSGAVGNGSYSATIGSSQITKTYLRGQLIDSSYNNSHKDSVLTIGENHELKQMPFSIGITKAALTDSVTASSLHAGRWYNITDATSGGLSIYVMATSTDQIDSSHVVVPGYEYTSAEYRPTADEIVLTDRCFGVLRCTAGIWGWVTDPGHDKENLDTVYVDTNGFLHADFSKQDYYTGVGDIIAVIDNNYPFFQIQCGTSVGVNTVIIGFYRSFNIADSVYYNGASFLNANTTQTLATSDSIKWNSTTSALTIYQHDTIPGANAVSYGFPKTYPNITGVDGGYTAQLYQCDASSFSVRFYDNTGALITTPDSKCKFVYQRIASNREIVGTSQFAAYLSQATTNIWLQGWMHKTIE